MDYVVTNLGLNTRYHPSRDEPCLIYYGRPEDSAEPQIIEATATNIPNTAQDFLFLKRPVQRQPFFEQWRDAVRKA